MTTGWLTVDPIFSLSGLGTNLVSGPLPGLSSLDPNAGITTQALGHYAAEEWLAGRIPWWNPFGGIGLPLAAEGQNPALFLPFVLLLALRNGPLLLLLALQEVAAFSTYALLRQVGLGVVASWTGGALFAVNGTFAWFADGPMMPVAFLPLLLLGVEREWAAAQPGRARCAMGWPIAAIAVALSLYAGFPETAYLDALLAAVWALVRLVCCDRSRRLALAIRTGLGAVAGALLAAPFIVAFAHMLTVSDIGMHAADLAVVGAPAGALPPLALPYVYGPLTFGAGEGGPMLWLWDFLGGYLSLPVVTLAVAALLTPSGRHRALRWTLAAWIVLTLGASFGIPGITGAVYAFPGLAHVQVFRYAPPSWQLAGIVLAAMAVDDWIRGTAGSRRSAVAVSVAIAVAAAGGALATGHPAIAFLSARVPHYAPWLAASLLWAALGTVAATVLLASRTSRLRRGLLAGLLVCDGVTLFCVPRLAGLRQPSLDMAGVRFLQRHLGLDRAYSLGVLAPNYAAYFRVAAINQDTLPTPTLWADHVGTVLDPWTDRNAFTGAFQWPGQARPDHIAEFRRRMPAFEDLGVRYVLVPAAESLAPVVRMPTGPNAEAVELGPDGRLDATPPAALPAGDVDTVSVLIGTYKGAANGALAVTACAGSVCARGMAELATAPDNRPLAMRLDHPLTVGPGSAVRLRLDHVGGTASVAIWQAGGVADWSFGYVAPGLAARPVFSDRVMTVYALANPAPYFVAKAGACRVDPVSREAVRAECAAPDRLVRRELFFPGWRATVNGAPSKVSHAAPIFQEVALPSGSSTVVFSYAPPFATASSVACAGGCLLVLGGFTHSWLRERRRHPASTPTGS